MSSFPRRGEIFWVKLDPTVGSEINKIRPAVIISNDVGNEFSRRVIVAPVTSNAAKVYPFEVAVEIKNREGKILLDQIRSVDKVRLSKKLGFCGDEALAAVDKVLKRVLDLR